MEIIQRITEHCKRNKITGCFEWQGAITRTGYGNITTCKSGKKIWHPVHRLLWELLNGKIPSGLFICHRCDNRRCCEPSHLFLGTAKDNTQDMVKKGRDSRGSRQGCSKLKEEQVKIIRQQYAENKITQKMLAVQYGVCVATIHLIINRKKWKHVT